MVAGKSNEISMAVERSMFETLEPSRFITFTFPNPSLSHSLLRVSVIDSPIKSSDSPFVAAMFVPEFRETDWIFSTESGQLQLLQNSPMVSRLILLGNNPGADFPRAFYRRPLKIDTTLRDGLEVSLKPLLLALAPKSCFEKGVPEIPILSYEDNLICGLVLERCVGSFVGEMQVEDVEIECEVELGKVKQREFRRRLRFKRMPNLIQTEIRIVPKAGSSMDCVEIGGTEFMPDDNGDLVHPYLAPMGASLSLIASSIEERTRNGRRPKALCLGVGGGALLDFLRNHLDFEVVGVEIDGEVLKIARKYFRLKADEFTRICVGDALDFIMNLANGKVNRKLDLSDSQEVQNQCPFSEENDYRSNFDVIMVDLDSSDAREGTSAPPVEFVREEVLLAARSLLCQHGILVINVVPLNKRFYDTLIHTLKKVFQELYEIDVGNEENYVVIAAISPIISSARKTGNSFLDSFELLVSGTHVNSMRKI